jgi:hypothetical protein
VKRACHPLAIIARAEHGCRLRQPDPSRAPSEWDALEEDVAAKASEGSGFRPSHTQALKLFLCPQGMAGGLKRAHEGDPPPQRMSQ